MKKTKVLVLIVSLLLSILCREFYKQEYSDVFQVFLMFVTSLYFLPLMFSLGVKQDLFYAQNISKTKMGLYVCLLLAPYFFALFIDNSAARTLGSNIFFVGLWCSLALCAWKFEKIKYWLGIALTLSIWFAFELDLLVFWQGSLYFLNVLLGIDLVIILFPMFLRFRPFAMEFKMSYLWAKPLHKYSIVFLLVAVPYGLLSGFLSLKSNIDPIQIPIQFLAIFFFNALPEEILFRGLLQEQVQRYMKANLALLLVSIAFGFAHLNNFPKWDYRFVLISFIAGLCFGIVYLRTRSIVPAALLHTIINTTNAIAFDKVPLI